MRIRIQSGGRISMAVFSLIALASPAQAASGGVAPDPGADKVLQALVDELPRCLQLKTSTFSPPFHATAEAAHYDTFQVEADFGALVSEGRVSAGSARGAVLVGTPDVNNGGSMGMAMAGGRGGFRGPSDLDYDALRRAVWLSCDSDYKNGLNQLAGKKAMLSTNEVHDRPADFSDAPASTVIEPPASLQFDRERWEHVVKRASAVFRDEPLADTGSASFNALAMTQWLASSEPIQNRLGETMFSVMMESTAQAPDGREISAFYSLHALSEKELPGDDALLGTAHDLAAQLKALAAAPVLEEDYAGPVLFSGQAAAVFFLSTVAGPLGRNAGMGRMMQQGGGFADRRGQRVASKLLTVRDDPNQKAWHGRGLLGYFPVDDDGVKPQAITLIDKGVLKTPYLSRIPVKAGDHSNGHSRAGYGSAGNMFVDAAKSVPRAKLEAQLIALAREDGLDSGLLVEQLTESGGPGGYGDQVMLPPPLRVWRVHVNGKKELIRNVNFKPASLRVLTDIEAMGNDPYLFNSRSMGQPVSVVTPSVLVRRLDVAKPGDVSDKPPEVPRPVVTQKP